MNETEFEQAFREFFSPMCTIAYSVVKDQDSAKDIVQQVFLKVWDNRNSLKIHSQLRSYLHRAVINTALNYLERHKKLHIQTDMEQYDVPEKENETENLRDEQLSRQVLAEIEKLPGKCKLVFSLSRFSEMSNKEIAQHLDISIKAVEKHIGRALKELRVSLKPIFNTLLSVLFLLFTGRVF